jgi:hypothetical protein
VQDQKSTGASKKILEGCTSLDQLKEILIKQLGPTKVGASWAAAVEEEHMCGVKLCST